MALFDAVGKTLNVPIHALLGNKVRDWAPISWWAIDMPPEDWAKQCAAAVEQGYMSAKLKARTWFDLHAALKAVLEVVPRQFLLDLDFNATLGNAANAVHFLKTLEQYEQVAMIETPIPHEDVAGNAHIRRRIDRPLAMHYGTPPILTTLDNDLADGFVDLRGGRSSPQQCPPLRRCQQALLDSDGRHRDHNGVGRTLGWCCAAGGLARDHLYEYL